MQNILYRLNCFSLMFAILLFFIFQTAVFAKIEPKVDPQYKVLLAKTWDRKSKIEGWWMSEKLDGVRAYWTGKELISRSGKPFFIPTEFTKNFPDTPLDGELWIGRDQFQDLMRVIQTDTHLHKNWDKVRYYVFDAPKAKGIFEERIRWVKEWFKTHKSYTAIVLSQIKCNGTSHLFEKLKEVEEKNGEGMMLRKPNSLYETGRSHTLLKVKSYQDREAKVVGYRTGKGKYKGMVGAVVVKLENKVQFAIGSGLTDELRRNPPPLGSIITFKHYGFTKKGIPRFASFLRVWEGM